MRVDVFLQPITNKFELEMGIDAVAETNEGLLRKEEVIDQAQDTAVTVLFATAAAAYLVVKAIGKDRKFW